MPEKENTSSEERKHTTSKKGISEDNFGDEWASSEKIPKRKRDSRFVGGIKKVGFSVWLGVMIIGGILAFIVAAFLL